MSTQAKRQALDGRFVSVRTTGNILVQVKHTAVSGMSSSQAKKRLQGAGILDKEGKLAKNLR